MLWHNKRELTNRSHWLHSAPLTTIVSCLPALKKGKVERKEVTLQTESAIQELNGCLYNTNWDAFKDSCTDLNELTDTVVNYITFCEGMIIPRKTITLYPNNKPWVSKSLNNSLMKKSLLSGRYNSTKRSSKNSEKGNQAGQNAVQR